MKLRDPGLVFFGGVSVTDGVSAILLSHLGLRCQDNSVLRRLSAQARPPSIFSIIGMGQFVRIPDESLHTCS